MSPWSSARLIAAAKAKLDLDFKLAAAIDLAGRNILEAVQTSVNPKVIDCPGRGLGKESLDGVAQNGIQLKVKTRVTVRANLRQLIGGATEETIVARVGEGIVSAIGTAKTHSEVLASPDRISKTVLARRLDSQTAFEIVSIDIADINVGENIGARLQADQAEADMRVARANAEGRRAMAVAEEQEMIAQIEENRSTLVEAEAEVPKAIADAFRNGQLGLMEFYKLRNIQADTDMRIGNLQGRHRHGCQIRDRGMNALTLFALNVGDVIQIVVLILIVLVSAIGKLLSSMAQNKRPAAPQRPPVLPNSRSNRRCKPRMHAPKRSRKKSTNSSAAQPRKSKLHLAVLCRLRLCKNWSRTVLLAGYRSQALRLHNTMRPSRPKWCVKDRSAEQSANMSTNTSMKRNSLSVPIKMGGDVAAADSKIEQHLKETFGHGISQLASKPGETAAAPTSASTGFFEDEVPVLAAAGTGLAVAAEQCRQSAAGNRLK